MRREHAMENAALIEKTRKAPFAESQGLRINLSFVLSSDQPMTDRLILLMLVATVFAATSCAPRGAKKTTATMPAPPAEAAPAAAIGPPPTYDEPQSYDPPGSTNTTSRAISAQTRATFSFARGSASVITDFDGARLTRVTRVDDTTYVGIVAPENAPINNSPWYAFKLWSPTRRRIRFRLEYYDGDHRYRPRISRNGRSWELLDRSAYQLDSLTGDHVLLLEAGPDTLWVAAQELLTSQQVNDWMFSMAARAWVTVDTIGASMLGRPIMKMEITESPRSQDYVFVIGRQHPPEVTGALALQEFIETVAGPSPLARRFRRRFKVVAVPLVNPDGVDGGHWRHNAGGIDLNRDWYAFNQPEPRVVRDEFLRIRESLGGRAWFGIDFHSTWNDIIYTLDSSIVTRPAGFTSRWIENLEWLVPTYRVRQEPAGLESPIFKSWFYREFGAPVVTYEVGDGVNRDRLKEIAAAAADAMMELLLAEAESGQ